MENIKTYLTDQATPKEFYELANNAQNELIEIMSHSVCPKVKELSSFIRFSLLLMKAVECDVENETDKES
ncbi:MAG: hypothetical protein II927_00525 [Paludibacteraceae bacterium]|nr:hypothetical protein [Paludibacteraceae bacterium]MBQ7748284.1 hypothetical protein [Paludibacteraceae bacterium]